MPPLAICQAIGLCGASGEPLWFADLRFHLHLACWIGLARCQFITFCSASSDPCIAWHCLLACAAR